MRTLDAEALADYEALSATTFWSEAQSSGEIVRTRRLEELPSATDGGWVAALEHERIPVVSYPSEWTFAMLKNAALLHLRMLEGAVAEGIVSKDANAYNVQFQGSRPTFIDVGSFTRIRAGEPWYGFRQYCEHFLNPLVLHAYGRLEIPESLRGSVNGIPPRTASALLPRRARLRPSLFTTIVLHATAEKRMAGRDADVTGALQKAGAGPALISAQIKRLRRITESLETDTTSSEWSGYGERGHYSDSGMSAKEQFVSSAVESMQPKQVLDLGANDGAFSRLALRHGAGYAVATDGDPVVIDRLYRELAAAGDETILPLCIDLADMSGGHGWAGRQRSALFDRVRPDLVLCLALIHHLAITASVRVSAIIDLLADLGAPVVLELPLPEDPMAARLLSRKRDRKVPGYTRAEIETEMRRRFTIARELTLPGETRVIYELRPR